MPSVVNFPKSSTGDVWILDRVHVAQTGLADLNHLDLNYRFKSRFKLIVLFFPKNQGFKSIFLFLFKLWTNQSCFG